MLSFKIFCKYPHIRWQNPLDEFNYFQFTILFPSISLGKSNLPWAMEYPFEIMFSFDTIFEFLKLEFGWNFKFRLFGFGFNIKYQNGY